jgi:hypothetical protein
VGEAESLPSHIGRHFQVLSSLGAGGTSRVLHVVDRRSGEHMSLKQALAPAPGRRARSHALFRQEFHVLSRIVHPNVVRAYELGVADERPFYTMELLRGRALSELAPIAWQRLCTVILDLCSPLSMLHARRFVHGDVTARNVLVTERGETKLIDFGALTATDRPVSIIAGTPPHMAPELVQRQAIDGRVDMFAIGALAYNMLTGQHAYPAHTVQELQHVWNAPPPSVRQRGCAIPAALDALIMSLLSLDASARPLQLAELVQRLSALLDTSYALDTSSLQAQLATPNLVGRRPALEAYGAAQQAVLAGRGAVLCFTGSRGMGRSRMLETCALEAIRADCLVIHVTPEQAPSVPFGLVAHVVLAAHAQESAVAAGLPSELRAALEDPSDGGLQLAAALACQPEAGLQACWRALCAGRTLVVLLDDLTRADTASMRHCLSLRDDVASWPLLLVAAIETSEHTATLAASQTIELDALTEDETAQLLRSVFGEAAQLEALVAWVWRAAAGVPGACVALAHHALEHGYVRFVAGQFRVSEQVGSGTAALPEAFDATIAAASQALSPRACEALAALSLVTSFGPLTAAEQTQLLGGAGWSQAEVLDALDELCDAELIELAVSGYELRFTGSAQQAAALLDATRTRAWQLRIAQLYAQRGHAARMLSALHYDLAGETRTAYETLLTLDGQLRGPDDPNIELSSSELGIALHRRMLQHALTSGAPRVEVVCFRRELLRIGATADARLGSEAPALIEQLRDDAGLLYWDSYDADLSDHARLQLCLARAQERFERSSPQQHLPPSEAIEHLAESLATTASICEAAFDAHTALRLAEQFRPLRVLSPLLELSYRQVETTALQLSRGGLSIERWRSQLHAFQERQEGRPDLSNLHYHLGRELALLGDPQALTHASVLAAPLACSVRLLYALAYGDHEAAAVQRRQRAISALASRHEDQRLAASYAAEIELLDACGDLLELQRSAAWLEAKAVELPGFRAFASYARACCLFASGQVSEAQQHVELQVHEVPVLEHAAWLPLRALRAELALAAGEAGLAQELAQDVLRIADEAGIDMRAHSRARRVLALACAALGELTRAREVLEPLAQALSAEPASLTVQAGQLHETYARIALAGADDALSSEHCARAQAIYSRTGNPGLTARLQQLTASASHSQALR